MSTEEDAGIDTDVEQQVTPVIPKDGYKRQIMHPHQIVSL